VSAGATAFLHFANKRVVAEVVAKNEAHQVLFVAALSAIGHDPWNNPFGISPAGYGRCDFWSAPRCSGISARATILQSPKELDVVVDALQRPCKYLVPSGKNEHKQADAGKNAVYWAGMRTTAASMAVCSGVFPPGVIRDDTGRKILLALYEGDAPVDGKFVRVMEFIGGPEKQGSPGSVR
jgi:hypothetical protein